MVLKYHSSVPSFRFKNDCNYLLLLVAIEQLLPSHEVIFFALQVCRLIVSGDHFEDTYLIINSLRVQ